MALQVEVGNYYRTRDGRKVGPLRVRESGNFDLGHGKVGLWSEDGVSMWPDNREEDIIGKWQETPDLTAITTPFGLLDEASQEALRAHGGPYERFWCGNWEDPPSYEWDGDYVHRVKPAPKVETVTLQKFIDEYGNIKQSDDTGQRPLVNVTFTRTNGVIDLDSYKVEAR